MTVEWVIASRARMRGLGVGWGGERPSTKEAKPT